MISAPESPPNPPPRGSRILKHAVDRALALLALPVVLLLLAVLAAAIGLDDILSGERLASPFVLERRISRNREFAMLKLRVLRPRALRRRRATGHATVKDAEHDRASVSRVGEVLVRFYLDELPQLLHVLAGTMSLVGPRPVWPHDVARVRRFAPFAIKGGLAGTFQLAKGTDDILALDEVYLREYETRGEIGLLLYDLGVLLRTVRKMLRGEGL